MYFLIISYCRFSRQTWVTFLQCHQQRLVSSILGGKGKHTLWKYKVEIQSGNAKWKYKLEIQSGNTNWKGEKSNHTNYTTNYIAFQSM